MTKQEWDEIYHNVMPLVSVAVGVTGILVAVWSAQARSTQTVGLGGLELHANGHLARALDYMGLNIPKVHYEDSQVLVSVRQPGEWVDIRDFIDPLNPEVQSVYRQVGPDPAALHDWVCRNITYHLDNGEWWEYPEETLRRRLADCDGTSILLESLLANFTDAYVAVGDYRGLGHAWCQIDGQILETTFTSARPVPDPQNYRVYALFNDEEVIEMWPGALTQLFQLARNSPHKLSLMAAASRGA